MTGTVGVKPTYGSVSRYGVIAMASSLDQVGPCSRTVLDAALLHEVVGGHDPADSTSLTDPVGSYARAARAREATIPPARDSGSALARVSDPAVDLADAKEREIWLRGKHRDFKRHLGMFVLVNFAFLILGLLTHAFPWTLIPGLLWSIGLGAHALTLYTTDEEEWREYREEMRRRDWKRKKREEVMSQVVDQGVSMLLKKGAAMRRRYGGGGELAAAPPARGEEKMRIAPFDARAAEAEADADLEAAAQEAAQEAARAQVERRRR